MTILFVITLLLVPRVFAQEPTGDQPAEDQQPAAEQAQAETANSCTEDTFYTDSNGDCIHKSGGAHDPENGSADEQGCVYNFQKEDDKNKCTTQNQPPASTNPAPITNSQGQKVNKENYKAPQNFNYLVINAEHSLFCEVTGFSPVDDCLGIKKDENGKPAAYLYKQLPGGGAVGGISSLIAATYNPPTSSVEYLADLFGNMGLAPKEAYAQVGGSGAGIIKPVESLWKVSRNIAFVLFIVVFIVVGFMIMFRRKINPQTVISIQQALPGLVLGILLVTFSYFIAALIIDMSFLGIQLVAQFFIQSGEKVVNVGANDIAGAANNSNVFQLFISSIRLPENVADVTGGIYRTLSSVGGGGSGGAAVVGVATLIPAIIGAVVGTIMFPGAGTLLGIVGGIGLGTAGGAVIGGALPAVIGLIVPLVLILALIVQFFRLLWQLVSSYISLLLATVAGPLILVFASIPGRGGIMGWWWKTLLANSLVFPAVFAAFLLAGMILGLPTEIFSAQPPLFGGLSVELLRLILAYGIILGTPSIPLLVKGAFGVKGPEAFAQAAYLGVEAGSSPLRAGTTSALNRFRLATEAHEREQTIGATPGTPRAPILEDQRMGRFMGNPIGRALARFLGGRR